MMDGTVMEMVKGPCRMIEEIEFKLRLNMYICTDGCMIRLHGERPKHRRTGGEKATLDATIIV